MEKGPQITHKNVWPHTQMPRTEFDLSSSGNIRLKHVLKFRILNHSTIDGSHLNWSLHKTGHGTWGAEDCRIQSSGQWELRTGGWDKACALDGRYLHHLAGPKEDLLCKRHNTHRTAENSHTLLWICRRLILNQKGFSSPQISSYSVSCWNLKCICVYYPNALLATFKYHWLWCHLAMIKISSCKTNPKKSHYMNYVHKATEQTFCNSHDIILLSQSKCL